MPSMRDLVEKHLANGLDEFKGLHISGSIPVRQEIINEFLAELVQSGLVNHFTGTDAPPPRSFGLNDALRLVKRAEVKANQGIITVEFELQV